ncbi:hypothetical protein ACFL67_03385 [candidate division KSB1 bacterium]
MNRIFRGRTVTVFLVILFALFFCSKQNAGIFEEPYLVMVGGEMLNTGAIGHAAPYVFDFNSDGKNDLLVGYFGSPDKEDKSIQGGKLLIYLNTGTNQKPVYDQGEHFNIDGKYGTVPSG